MALQIEKYKVRLELCEDILGTVPMNRDVYATYLLTKARQAMEKEAKKGGHLTNGEPHSDEAVTALLEPEVETIQEVEERGWTTFHCDEPDGGKPFLYNYAVKGFLKEAARTLKEFDPDKNGAGEPAESEEPDVDEKPKKGKAKAPKSTVLKQLQDKVSRYVFIKDRKVYFQIPEHLAHVPEPGLPAGSLMARRKLASIERPLRAQTAQGPRVTVVRSDIVPAGTVLEFELHVLKGGGVTRQLLEDIFAYGNYQGLGQWRSGGYGRIELMQLERI